MTEEKMKTSIGIKDPAHTPFPHRGTHVTPLQLMRASASLVRGDEREEINVSNSKFAC